VRGLHFAVVVDVSQQLHTSARCLQLLLRAIWPDAEGRLGGLRVVRRGMLVSWRLPSKAGRPKEVWGAVQELCRLENRGRWWPACTHSAADDTSPLADSSSEPDDDSAADDTSPLADSSPEPDDD